MSDRDVQELLFECGIDVTYDAIRQWCLRFGQDYANQLRRRRPQPGDGLVKLLNIPPNHLAAAVDPVRKMG